VTRLALLLARVADAYLDIYHGHDDSGADSGMPAHDTRSTTGGTFDIAARGGPEFGFTRPARRLRLRDINVGGPDGE
jgi:hypothetical protein